MSNAFTRFLENITDAKQLTMMFLFYLIFIKHYLIEVFLQKIYVYQEFEWLNSFCRKKDINQYLILNRKGRKIPFLEDDRECILEAEIAGWQKNGGRWSY